MFEEAEIKDTDKKQDVVSITTDDLVFLIGEKVIENKFQDRVLTLQKGKIIELEKQLLNIQSQKVSSESLITETKTLNEKSITELKTQHEQTVSQLEEQLSKLTSSQHEYTISFENKVHEVALERDECRKELSALKAEINILKQENETLSSLKDKKPKKGVRQWLTHSK